MAYQFDNPLVMDSRRSESLLGLSPTPLADGARATVDWWRETHTGLNRGPAGRYPEGVGDPLWGAAGFPPGTSEAP